MADRRGRHRDQRPRPQPAPARRLRADEAVAMRVLFTGVSSFTGLWFARALQAAGCEVVAPLRGAAYEDPLRRARLAEAAKVAEIVPAAPFGSPAFLDVLARGFDVLCHHAAEAANHKSPDFDVEG